MISLPITGKPLKVKSVSRKAIHLNPIMKKPKAVADFYNSLETIKSLGVWNISKELAECEEIKSTLWRKRVLTERKVLFHNLNEGLLLPNAQTTDHHGQSGKALAFSKPEINYLTVRLDETSNYWIRARYAHLLWQETKNNNFAVIAIDSYMGCIHMIKGEEARELDIILSAILHISKNTKKRQQESIKLVLELMGTLPNWFRFTILNTALKFNFLNSKVLNEIADKVFEWLDEQSPVAYFNNKQHLEILLVLFDKIKRPAEEIYAMLAANEDEVINQHDDESFVKYTALAEKAKYLKKAKQLPEYEATLKQCNQLKLKTKLYKISVAPDAELNDMFNDYLRKKSGYLLSLSTETILSFFAVNDEIIADPKAIAQQASENIQKSIHHLFTTSVFDINGNTKRLNDKEKLDFEKLNTYVITHNVQVYTLFLRVFIDGIIMGKFTYYKIFEYLEAHTWYGMKFRRSLKNQDEEGNSSWLSLLAPGIHSFFSQFELSTLMNTNRVNNFVLAVDSMTLKFEGALRDFVRLSGGNTMVEKKGEMQEQLLEDLLENKVTKAFFNEKDIELFKFTFTKKGKNIRNNVAHCFLEYSDYSLQTSALVFFCLLRLGKYTFEEKAD